MTPGGYTVILIPSPGGRVAALVPAMPGCFSAGDTREQALARIGDAMAIWTEVEENSGRVPLRESSAVVTSAVGEALKTIDDMRRGGDLLDDAGYHLELVTVRPRQHVGA